MVVPYRDLIVATAAKFKLAPDLLMAQVLVESAGNTDAFRHEPAFWQRYMASKPEWANAMPRRVSSSYGLLQIMYPVAVEHGFTGAPEMLFVPEIGLEWGARHLRTVFDWSLGHVPQALAAYNGGKGGNATAPYRNQSYVDKVMARVRTLTAT